MKKITTTLTLIVAILLLFSGCKKDFSDKYVGDWKFISKMHASYEQYEIDTTYYYLGKITHGDSDYNLCIQYMDNCGIFVNVDKYGQLTGNVSNSSSGYNYIQGQFEGKERLNIEFSYGRINMSGKISMDVEGVKKSKKNKNEK